MRVKLSSRTGRWIALPLLSYQSMAWASLPILHHLKAELITRKTYFERKDQFYGEVEDILTE